MRPRSDTSYPFDLAHVRTDAVSVVAAVLGARPVVRAAPRRPRPGAAAGGPGRPDRLGLRSPADQPSASRWQQAPLDSVDDDILAQIASMYSQADPVPDGVVERITFTLALAEMEAELAEIQLLNAELAGARSDVETVRTISFAASTVTIVVTIGDASPDRVRIDGWLSPAHAMPVELRSVSEHLVGTADVNGRFVFDDVRTGLASVVVHPSGAERPVATPTFQL